VPYGYQVLGQKKQARLALSESLLPGLELSEADVVRLIYRLLAEEGYSWIRIAEHLNALGVPTAYVRDKRHVKSRYSTEEQKIPTAGVWRYGRVRDLVVNPVYKGQYVYGRRSKTNREASISPVPAIIDEHTWDMAQQRLEKKSPLRHA
jgi:site-specific DNA recombinase